MAGTNKLHLTTLDSAGATPLYLPLRRGDLALLFLKLLTLLSERSLSQYKSDGIEVFSMLFDNKVKIIITASAAVVLLIAGAVSSAVSRPAETVPVETTQPTEVALKYESHMIPSVKAELQDTLMAGCETHACVSLLKSLGYDIDIFRFADSYLDCKPVTEDEVTGEKFGPDMNSAFAGTAYAGWGAYAPSMAKSMNRYLSDVKSEQKAYVLEGRPTLEELCRDYIDNDIPVVIWATSDMKEPFEHEMWEINYVDENAKYKLGDKFVWMIYEHCLVLCGYDKDYYYFSDSIVGDISHYAHDLSETRYEQLGWQAIVVK